MTIKVKEFRAESAGKAATPRVGLLRLERLAGILEAAHKRYKKIGALLTDLDEDGRPEYQEIDHDTDLPLPVEGYDQTTVGHACGTPACAIGHYGYNTPARWGWTKAGDVQTALDFHSDNWFEQAGHEFCLATRDADDRTENSEVEELFGGIGCGRAKTALEAARYIRKFVAKKRKELGFKKPASKLPKLAVPV